jgi:hypothetical protein
MSQQNPWQTHPFSVNISERNSSPNMGVDDSSTFVNPLHDGSSQEYFPYTFSPETVIPPPPPGMPSPRVSPSKNTRGYQIALALLAVFVVVPGALEVIQFVARSPGVLYPLGSAGSSQAGSIPTRYATLHARTLSAGTIKENVRLTCNGCDDPVLTTITSIMVDTINLRTVWTIRLENVSGAQQIEYFAEFNLQDPFGNTYVGTGNLNTDFYLDSGQTDVKTEIFSFLPRPGVSYVLSARLGIAGTTFDPLQVTF